MYVVQTVWQWRLLSCVLSLLAHVLMVGLVQVQVPGLLILVQSPILLQTFSQEWVHCTPSLASVLTSFCAAVVTATSFDSVLQSFTERVE